MIEDAGNETSTETDGGASGMGYRRLESELNSVRAEFESLVARTDTEGADDGWVRRGRTLLDKANVALEDQQLEQGWSYLHAVERLAMNGLEAVGGEDAIRGEARVLLVEAENAPLSWRAEAVKDRLANTDGNLREEVTADDLRAAHELLHEGYESIHRKRQHLQAQFRYLRIGALLTIIAILLVAIAGASVEFLATPFFEFQTGTSSGDTSATQAELVGFLIYIVLFGMLGATLFGIRSLRRQPASTSTPQYLTGFQATVARVVVGAGSALAVFFFLRSELLTVGAGSNLTQGPFLIAVAFAAGYSQRLVHATVESVAATAKSTSSESSET